LFVAIVGGLYRPYLIVELVSRRSPDEAKCRTLDEKSIDVKIFAGRP
jgi:hypothetical protein